MAFGQQSGPPASGRQVKELLTLLEQAGYAGFREARGPLGFTQRQGLGKFTQDEAAELIERLTESEHGPAPAAEPVAAPAAPMTKPSRCRGPTGQGGPAGIDPGPDPGAPAGRGARTAGLDPHPARGPDHAGAPVSLIGSDHRSCPWRATSVISSGSGASGHRSRPWRATSVIRTDGIRSAGGRWSGRPLREGRRRRWRRRRFRMAAAVAHPAPAPGHRERREREQEPGEGEHDEAAGHQRDQPGAEPVEEARQVAADLELLLRREPRLDASP